LPIHCQINVGSADKVAAPGKMGEIAKAAAQNVRASIKKVLKKIGAPNVGYEMHVEYIQAHGGVEGSRPRAGVPSGGPRWRVGSERIRSTMASERAA